MTSTACPQPRPQRQGEGRRREFHTAPTLTEMATHRIVDAEAGSAKNKKEGG